MCVGEKHLEVGPHCEEWEGNSVPGRHCPCMVSRRRRKEILTIARAPFQIVLSATEAHIGVHKGYSLQQLGWFAQCKPR